MQKSSAQLIPISSVRVPEDRQRKSFDPGALDSLADSLQRIGQIQPIVIDRAGTLIAGERRLRAAQKIGWSEIAFVYYDALSEAEAQIVELEENIKRQNLTWQEEIDAIRKLHEVFKSLDAEWTLERTAGAIGVSGATVSRALTVQAAIQENPKLLEASGLSAAYNFVSRQQARAAETELAKAFAIEESPSEGQGQSQDSSPSSGALILVQDFLTWEPPSGQLFNLLHCDFPYGVELGSSNLQTTSKLWEKYGDEEPTYWSLIERLGVFQQRHVAPSAHMIFWFSMKFYRETFDALSSLGWKVDSFPLVWHKSDGRGLLPDPSRGPRRVYETAFLCTLGDRKIVRPVANAISAPTFKSEAIHLSEKPYAVVHHFLSMLTDEHTTLLDPTCGGGSAIAAASALGASSSVGLEISPTIAAAAQDRLLRGAHEDTLLDGLAAP
jgi:ParB family chromosome partitioning protein